MSRSKPTYFYAIVSVAMVLFILGFFAIMATHARQLATMFKEKVDIWLELQANTPQEEIARMVQDIRRQPFVKQESVTFITREQAQSTMKKDLGDESLLEDVPNLLRDVIRFNVRAEFLQNDSLLNWRETLRRDTFISDLYFEAANTGNVGKNIQNLGWIILGLGILLIFAAVTLIHNTIRLALFSNRFLIKNQELVGASWAFISRPYLVRGIMNGLWSALLAIAALIGTQWGASRLMPDLQQIEDLNSILAIFVLLILLGILISGLSTYFVVQKFLRMRVDDLY
ncbi:MAG: permease-like cell division protein FtsX [Saprospiraceae bacterium]|nr:permease-like cell division protein FtsX [Saprospiraceae bacterium]